MSAFAPSSNVAGFLTSKMPETTESTQKVVHAGDHAARLVVGALSQAGPMTLEALQKQVGDDTMPGLDYLKELEWVSVDSGKIELTDFAKRAARAFVFK
jgi:hypothetical protein